MSFDVVNQVEVPIVEQSIKSETEVTNCTHRGVREGPGRKNFAIVSKLVSVAP
jgi:hypothetical protein